MSRSVSILSLGDLTHGVKRLALYDPISPSSDPGRPRRSPSTRTTGATKRVPFPLTFTSLDLGRSRADRRDPPRDHGVTEQIGRIEPGDRIELGGAIRFRGSGCVIALGAGITPLLALVRNPDQRGELAGNRLRFSDETDNDIPLRPELEVSGAYSVFTPGSSLALGPTHRELLEAHVDDVDQHFHPCGPEAMVERIPGHLEDLGPAADSIALAD